MIPIEKRMNDNEIKILKNKISQTSIVIIGLLLFIIAFLSVCYYSVQSFYFVLIGVLIISMFVYWYSTKLFGTRRDLNEKIKIIDKHEGIRRRNPSDFQIIFDSEVIKSCHVSENVFLKLNINDVIDIEYTKYGNWLLSIQYKGTDIESKYHIA